MTVPPSAPQDSSPDGLRRRLTRRRLLWGGSLLAPIAVLAGAVAFGKRFQTPEPQVPESQAASEATLLVRRAVQAATAGRLESARGAITEALTRAPEHPPALLVLVCIALEEGNSREAASALHRLRAVAPMRMEHVFLERLLAYRKREPSVAWSPAFRAAWVDAGRPDFEAQHLLADIPLEAHDSQVLQELWRGTSSVPARWILALASHPLDLEQAKWLLQQLPEQDDVALFVAAFDVLSHEALPEEFRSQATSELRSQLFRLARIHPRSMQLQLLSYLHGTSEEAPLNSSDLATLIALSELPTWRETSLADTFLSARQILRESGVANAGQQAFTVASLSITDRGSYLLRKRANVTRGGLARGARHSLGRILSHVGARMAENSTLLERTLGLLMMQQGAEDAEDPGVMEKVAALLDELYSAQAAWRRAAIDRWPLHSLLEEVLEAQARDEYALLRTFMAQPHAP
jgi:hypothetical protein